MDEIEESHVTDSLEQAVLGSALLETVLMKLILKTKSDVGDGIIRTVKDYVKKTAPAG